jgi:SAM-dependent methyltransferase
LLASDISPDMLHSARAALEDPSIDFQVADACQLPFTDASFDLVVCQHGMMFWPDKLRGFQEVFRVLKPGGRFVFASWAATTDMPLFKLILEDLVIPFFPKEDPSRFRVPFSQHDPEKLIGFLKESGFAGNQILPAEFHSGRVNYKDVVDGLFLKHPLSRQVAEKDPDMVQPMAENMRRKLSARFGPEPVVFDLKMLIGSGKK